MAGEEPYINLPVGISCNDEYVVQREYLASSVATGAVDVLATPYMIMFMEVTASKCVEKLLPEGFITVGIGVNIRHKNPAPYGTKVGVRVELLEQKGRVLVFRVIASLGGIVIGEGTHERYIIEKKRFEEKVLRMLKSVKNV
jgi:predicted thioesterase